MDADALLLSRIQFAFTIGFHILFPTLTIGLSGFLVLVEAQWLRSGDPAWRTLYRFWVKLFALNFGMGVVTGVVLEYELGTNFAGYIRATGNVLGPLLGYEVLSAFFLEAGFLGIMIFGWNRVGPRLHMLATTLVGIGTLISAFWILAANSWMQTPQGYRLVDGVFYVTDFRQVIFNPSFPYRFVHMVTAAYLTTAFVVAAVSAWRALHGDRGPVTRRGLAYGIGLAAFLAPLQIVIGDQHGLEVLAYQPMKVAAMEGLWQTTRGAPMLVFAVPDQAQAANRYEIGIPNLASLYLTHELEGEVKGLTEVPAADRPNVPLVFFAFRVMVGIGTLMVVVAGVALWLNARGRLLAARPVLHMLTWMGPSGFIAVLAGWVVAEAGRQPWVVQGLMRTADAGSPVGAGSVATSLALFLILYPILLIAFLTYAAKLVRRGPEADEPASPPHVLAARP
jgi:cytochrome bd ubiquinol oxidase subunit I